MSHLKPGTLKLRWDKRQGDFVIDYPSRPDGWLLWGLACLDRPHVDPATLKVGWEPSLIAELERRGYDTTTLVIQVRKRGAP